ncbi:MAG: L(+)-tartrate dehydratase subunit alpha [candidate division TA06 bacterium ADurb.Bin131]|uniref:L(+)-tartrate dehydratase subunit alpha n=1 Tax=candidate division TA06 bacterium ADurb.Bin131 TaxID=1852827 RepID=A0A1V6C7P5_UNCT6|nr:MAG: L(+)-tartrate dehydratase subunit alpha [candidate division TA06 bacterium ADurb.Bin131]
MKIIKEKDILEKIYHAVEKASFTLDPSIKQLIIDAQKKEKSPLGKKILDVIVQNLEIAQNKHLPICQDTGMVVIFFEIGSNTRIEFQHFETIQQIADEAVKKSYRDFYLRKSIVNIPDRKNTQDNTPAIVWYKNIPGDQFRFSLMIKGFGSENTTRLKMFRPTASIPEIIRFTVKCVKEAGPNPCPPVFVGLGMGGTAEKAVFLSKYALLDAGQPRNNETSIFEEQLISKINALGIGPGGFGGDITCLDARIKTYPTHIAGFPVAVSISCWAHRSHRGYL